MAYPVVEPGATCIGVDHLSTSALVQDVRKCLTVCIVIATAAPGMGLGDYARKHHFTLNVVMWGGPDCVDYHFAGTDVVAIGGVRWLSKPPLMGCGQYVCV